MILIFLLCKHTQKLPVTTLYTLWTIISLKNLKKYKFHFIKYKKKKEYAKALLKGFSFEKSYQTISSSE